MRNKRVSKSVRSFRLLLVIVLAVLSAVVLVACRESENRKDTDYIFFNPSVVSDTMQNGAYFITLDGIISYARATNPEVDEADIEYLLRDYEFLDFLKQHFHIVVYNNVFTFTIEFAFPVVVTTLEFSRVGNFYTADSVDKQVRFSRTGNYVNMALTWLVSGQTIDLDLQFKHDSDIGFADSQPIQIQSPINFNTFYTHLYWQTDAGFSRSRVEVKHAGQSAFSYVAKGVGSNISLSELNLQHGENVVRVTILGGPFLLDRQIHLFESSEPTTHTIRVDGVNFSVLSRPAGFCTLLGALSWHSDTRAFEERVYVKRDGQFQLLTRVYDSEIPLEYLSLVKGDNTIRITSSRGEGSAVLYNGILTVISDSQSAYYTIRVNAIEYIPLGAPINFVLADRWLSWTTHPFVNHYRVYIKREGEREFTRLLSHAWSDISLSVLDLQVGATVVRVKSADSGVVLQGGGRLVVYTSEYADFTITVRDINEIPAINHFWLTYEQLLWSTHHSNSFRVYTRHETEQNFTRVIYNYFGWDVVWNSIRLEYLNLRQGKNHIRLVSANHTHARLSNGTLFTYARHTYFDITI
ncbi:MAG: hypothetical protein FWB72_01540 [Firmicutes bacterium]|nr:hypothetical protein [Bacillota bacterium]